jgi:ribosomal protein S18 acetylase RimI-like enzyme
MAETAANEGFHEYENLVLEIGGALRGFVAFSHVELSWLYVDPTCYRSDIGSALVKAALRETGAALTVEVLTGNTSALSLYKKIGFAEVGQASGRMPGNERFAVTVTELRYVGLAPQVVQNEFVRR